MTSTNVIIFKVHGKTASVQWLYRIRSYIFSLHLQLGFLFGQQIHFLLFTLQVLDGLLLGWNKIRWAWLPHVSIHLLSSITWPHVHLTAKWHSGEIEVVWLQRKCHKSSPVWSDRWEAFSVFQSTSNECDGTQRAAETDWNSCTRSLWVLLHRLLLVFQTKSII